MFEQPIESNEVDGNNVVNAIKTLIGTGEKAPNELKSMISEKTKELSKLMEDLQRKRAENIKLEKELKSLQEIDNKFSAKCENYSIEQSVANQCNISDTVNDFIVESSMLETKLGFKLKLTADGEKEHLWEARFIFDPNEVSSSKYVSFTYDDRSESFKLVCMKPEPKLFPQMVAFFDETNDINGFLYSCWKMFSTDANHDAIAI